VGRLALVAVGRPQRHPDPRRSRGGGRRLKARLAGEISVSGPQLAQSLTDAGLDDEVRLYLHPVVLGRGKPFFAGPRSPLRLTAADRIDDEVIRLTYVPA